MFTYIKNMIRYEKKPESQVLADKMNIVGNTMENLNRSLSFLHDCLILLAGGSTAQNLQQMQKFS